MSSHPQHLQKKFKNSSRRCTKRSQSETIIDARGGREEISFRMHSNHFGVYLRLHTTHKKRRKNSIIAIASSLFSSSPSSSSLFGFFYTLFGLWNKFFPIQPEEDGFWEREVAPMGASETARVWPEMETWFMSFSRIARSVLMEFHAISTHDRRAKITTKSRWRAHGWFAWARVTHWWDIYWKITDCVELFATVIHFHFSQLNWHRTHFPPLSTQSLELCACRERIFDN